MIINAVYRDVIFDETRFPWKEAQDGKQVLRDADLQLPLPAETGRRGDLTERKQSGGTNLQDSTPAQEMDNMYPQVGSPGHARERRGRR